MANVSASDIADIKQIMLTMQKNMVYKADLDEQTRKTLVSVYSAVNRAVGSAGDSALKQHLEQHSAPILAKQEKFEANFEELFRRIGRIETEHNELKKSADERDSKCRARSVDGQLANHGQAELF